MYEVVLYPAAQERYAKADRALARKIARCLAQLEQNPRVHPNIKPLKDNFSGYDRYRAGDYRIIYSIDNQAKLVLVEAIEHRSKAYGS